MQQPPPPPPPSLPLSNPTPETLTLTLAPSKPKPTTEPVIDYTSLLYDPLLLHILSLLLPSPSLHSSLSLTSKRFLRLSSLLVRRLSLPSLPLPPLPHLLSRFPNLTHLTLLPPSFFPSSSSSSCSPILLSRSHFTVPIHPRSLHPTITPSDSVDQALHHVSQRCPHLLHLTVLNPGPGLLSIANDCNHIQELVLHRATHLALRSVPAFKNLKFLTLVASLEGLYTGPGIEDFGIIVIANGCGGLVRLELSGCGGGYDGISAIGKCCPLLEELVLCDHQMEDGWMAGLEFSGRLRRLRLVSCRRIDDEVGEVEELGRCGGIERLEIVKYRVRYRRSLKGLFWVCEGVEEVVFQNCWGLDNEMFAMASI